MVKRVTRHIDWLPRLSDYIKANRNKPFVWGERDCMLFAAGCVEAMTGNDLAAPFRGTYSTAREALEFLKKNGGTTGIVDRNFERIDKYDLQTGDIGLLVIDDREFIGIIYSMYAITPGVERQVMNRAIDCSIGWAV